MTYADLDCPLCDELAVHDVTLDLAYIEMAGQIFARAINDKDYEHAQAVVSNLIFSSRMLGRYTLHQAHKEARK